MQLNEYKEKIASGNLDERLKEIYVDESLVPYQKNRYVSALDNYKVLFGNDDISILSTPGRSEVCGNHTDHQHGMVLAASINLDAIAVAAPQEGRVVLKSDDFPMVEIETENLTICEEENGTTAALVRGVLAGLKERGYKIGGFKAFVTSDVLVGAGMSSSAAFEGLVGTIISSLYNDMKIPTSEIARAGQYAENVFFGKPCGLMDQMACCTGNIIYIDFEDPEKAEPEAISCDFGKAGLSLCIVDTKGSHADLTDDYAAIPEEMKMVAAACGKKLLRELSEEEFYLRLPEISKTLPSRAILRAVHFYEEEKRVLQAVEALRKEDFDTFLQVIETSGNSSAVNLQNLYSSKDPLTQNITMALALTRVFLGDKGVCRVHGGGFAGTIQVFVKNEAAQDYKAKIEQVFGQGSCHILRVRPCGGIRL